VAVCFDAPTVELLDDRALAIHPALARLGPDLLADDPDIEVAVARLRTPERASLTVAEGLLDQSAVAGIGNFHRSEVLWQAAVSPFLRVGEVSDATLRVLLETGIRLLRAGRQGTRPRNVYGRTGRQCPRCGAVIASRHLGRPPRLVFWCPSCQS
jgi:endonuclease-8